MTRSEAETREQSTIGKLIINKPYEEPAEYDGVLCITMDGQCAWRFTLIRELRNAGFDVDANRIL